MGFLFLCLPLTKIPMNWIFKYGLPSGVWMNGTASAYYIGNIPQSSLLMVKSPIKAEVRFAVGGKDIMYDGQGVVTLGNVLQSITGTDKFSFIL